MYQAYPVSKNKILLRLENIYDLFDADKLKESKLVQKTSRPQYLDVARFAEAFWREANPSSTRNVKAIVNEMNLSGNQLETDNENWKSTRRWIGKDDHLRPHFPIFVDT